MARNIRELTDKIMADPKRAANVKRHRREALTEIVNHALSELRTARGITQVELAESLNVQQSAVSKIERRADTGTIELQTLRNYVEALGGHLNISAVFGDDQIPLQV